MKSQNFRHSLTARLYLAVLAAAVWAAAGQVAMAASGEAAPDEAPAQLARLDTHLEAHPGDLAALAERARLYDATGRPMSAFLDRREILRQHPEDTGLARLAAFDLAAAAAPQAAAAFLAQYPAALAGEEGAALARRLRRPRRPPCALGLGRAGVRSHRAAP
ncbi:MAG TPA: hypothetical protein VH988_31825 [Thermoanaerobaculia bacterium]|nr:hypothetical protein [Thermoanaerobaculia bacterium]